MDTVDCRIGSLEILNADEVPPEVVDCRIGSLEIPRLLRMRQQLVDCRIGSLEKSTGFSVGWILR